jgi:hypothetical protein
MSITYPITVSGPFGQYTVEAIVEADATFTRIPTPALIEMGIEPARVVRLRCNDGEVRFFQLGRALTTAAGVEDIAPVLFGEPGTPAVLGSVTLSILMLELQGGELVPVAGRG